jgi:hypothetical protein
MQAEGQYGQMKKSCLEAIDNYQKSLSNPALLYNQKEK